jgi:hypothetical protein
LTLAENSFITYATMQDLDKTPSVLKFAEKKEFANKCSQLDETDDTSVQQAIQFVAKKKDK